MRVIPVTSSFFLLVTISNLSITNWNCQPEHIFVCEVLHTNKMEFVRLNMHLRNNCIWKGRMHKLLARVCSTGLSALIIIQKLGFFVCEIFNPEFPLGKLYYLVAARFKRVYILAPAFMSSLKFEFLTSAKKSVIPLMCLW